MPLPAEIDFTADPSASPARMDRAMASIDTRLRALELPAKSFDQVLATIQSVGLQRLTDAMEPIFNDLKAIASFGVLLSATSTSLVAIATGPASFTVPAGQKDNFAYTGWTMAVSQADTRDALLGRYLGYDRATGVLELDVVIASGAGQHADWLLMPSAPPLVPAATIDAGSDVAPQLQAAPWP